MLTFVDADARLIGSYPKAMKELQQVIDKRDADLSQRLLEAQKVIDSCLLVYYAC